MLEHFFGSKTRVKLLQILFKETERFFYLRELSRLSGVQLNAVRREMTNLEKIGLVERVSNEFVFNAGNNLTGNGRSKFFKVNVTSLIYPELSALLSKAQVIEEQELIETINKKAGKIKLFILTGNFTGAADVSTDLLLVGALKPFIISKIIKDYEINSGKGVRYTILNEKEFRERREIGDKFLYSVFESKNIMIINEYNLN